MSGHEAASGRLGPGAAWYASQGWEVFPVWGIVGGRCACGAAHPQPKDQGKHPQGALVPDGMLNASHDPAVVTAWWGTDEEANIGVACEPSGFIVVDVDPRNNGDDSWLKLEEMVDGELPPTVMADTGVYTGPRGMRRGRHHFYKVPAGTTFRGNLGKSLPGIDIKHKGYVLIAPSRHASGVCYDWVPGHAPWEIEMAEIPEKLLGLIAKRTRKSLDGTDMGWVDGVDIGGGERVDLDKLLAEGIDDGSRNVELHRMTCAVANRVGVRDKFGEDSVLATMMKFNHDMVNPPLDHDELIITVRKAIKYVKDNPVEEKIFPGIGPWREAMDAAREGRIGSSAAEPVVALPTVARVDDGLASVISVPVPTAGEVPEGIIFPNPDAVLAQDGGMPGMRSLSDLGNGRRLIDYAGDRLRFTAGMGWFVWNGSYWVPDDGDNMTHEIAKNLPVWIAQETVHYADPDDVKAVADWGAKTRSIAARKSAIADAQTDDRISVPVAQWDASPVLLGVKNGVIDLRTGALLPADPETYITKRAKVAYTPGMTHPLWREFLHQVTGGDVELQQWLQKAAGYTLTGMRTYDVLFIVFGPPGSGKSTFLEALGHMLGDYMWPMSSSVLVDEGKNSSTEEYHWAQLRGRRMVTMSELPEMRKMKEDAIKRLTGDMSISARFPGEKPFSFESQAKIWIGTNHKPRVEDEAMWRRIRAIPFNHVPEKPNPDLKHQLMDPEIALPAALAWAVEGAVRILSSSERDALGWCTAVREATDTYKSAEDRMGIFLTEELREHPGGSVPMRELYMIYKIWAEDRGEKPMSFTALTRKFVERGLKVDGPSRTAQLRDYSLMPRAVADASAPTDWTGIARFAR